MSDVLSTAVMPVGEEMAEGAPVGYDELDEAGEALSALIDGLDGHKPGGLDREERIAELEATVAQLRAQLDGVRAIVEQGAG